MLIETLEFLKNYIHQVSQDKVAISVTARQRSVIQLKLARLSIPKLDQLEETL